MPCVETPEGRVRCYYCKRPVLWSEVRWRDTGDATEWVDVPVDDLPGVGKAQVRQVHQVHVGCKYCYDDKAAAQ